MPSGSRLSKRRRRMTNGDRIRQMSDEELYAFRFMPCPGAHAVGERCREMENDCRLCWLAWLRQEAGE